MLKESTYETLGNRGTDAQSPCRRHLRTTAASKAGVFGEYRAHHDRPRANTITDEELLEGSGSLGPFTLRKLRTDETIPQSFGKCGDGAGPNLRIVNGGGVFRFQDGSLLTVTIIGGALCIDLDHLLGHLTETCQITGGTGRFEGAKGNLALTATLKVVLFNASNAAVLLTSTGNFEGTVSGVQ